MCSELGMDCTAKYHTAFCNQLSLIEFEKGEQFSNAGGYE